MIPFTPTKEEIPRLLDGSQTLIVRAVEVPEVNTAALGRDYTYPDVIEWADQIASGVCYPRKSHWCGLVDTGDGRRAWTYDIACPLGAPGDVVFCQEEWAYTTVTIDGVRHDGAYIYCRAFPDMCFDRQPPETMTEKHSRIYLRIKSVDCRRVQTITQDEARAAGIIHTDALTEMLPMYDFIREWDRNNPKRKTVTNPWAWFVGVERCERP